MIYEYIGNFIKESIPNYLNLGLDYREFYLNLVDNFYEYRNVFLWIIALSTYLNLFSMETFYIKATNENIKRIRYLEEENLKMKKTLEKLVQRQENYEELTTNVFLKEIENVKDKMKTENEKIIEFLNQMDENSNKNYDNFEKTALALKNTISIQKTRITKLKNHFEEKFGELSEQYETLSMNDSVSMINNDE
jgi:hypothetical protein